jgi:nicotinate-nucleotide--dimethylbenzimidazole phosphoribosyltransferase
MTETIEVPALASLDEVAGLLARLPKPSREAAGAAAARQDLLTKPRGALGRLEELAIWLAAWQRRPLPRARRVRIAVFAANHGVAARGVSAYPATVTAQMVRNDQAGGAAINRLAELAEAELSVVPLALDAPSADFTREPALTPDELLAALRAGMASVEPGLDLLCLGEMGIGNTTSAAALAAALFGGDAEAWAGRGSGVDDEGLARKRLMIDVGLARHRTALGAPLEALRRLGGRELGAIAGAVLAARHCRVPVLLDGFACTAAAAVLQRLAPDALEHCRIAHRSAEAGHGRLIEALGMRPLLDLDLRLGEASGAALALLLVHAALACHSGMATFAEAGVSNRDGGA